MQQPLRDLSEHFSQLRESNIVLVAAEADRLEKKLQRSIYTLNATALSDSRVVDAFLEYKQVRVLIFNRMIQIEEFADSIIESPMHNFFVREYLRLRVMHSKKARYTQEQIFDYYAKSRLPLAYQPAPKVELIDNTATARNDQQSSFAHSMSPPKKSPRPTSRPVDQQLNPTSRGPLINRKLTNLTNERFTYLSKIYELKSYLIQNRVNVNQFKSNGVSLESLMRETRADYCYLCLFDNKVCMSVNYCLVKITTANSEVLLDIDGSAEEVHPNFKLVKHEDVEVQVKEFVDDQYAHLLDWSDSTLEVVGHISYDMDPHDQYSGIYMKHNYIQVVIHTGWVNTDLVQQFSLKLKQTVFEEVTSNRSSPVNSPDKTFEFTSAMLANCDIAEDLTTLKDIKYKFPISSEPIFVKYRSKEFYKWAAPDIGVRELYNMMCFFLEHEEAKGRPSASVMCLSKLVFDITLVIADSPCIQESGMMHLYTSVNGIIEAFCGVVDHDDRITYNSMYKKVLDDINRVDEYDRVYGNYIDRNDFDRNESDQYDNQILQNINYSRAEQEEDDDWKNHVNIESYEDNINEEHNSIGVIEHYNYRQESNRQEDNEYNINQETDYIEFKEDNSNSNSKYVNKRQDSQKSNYHDYLHANAQTRRINQSPRRTYKPSNQTKLSASAFNSFLERQNYFKTKNENNLRNKREQKIRKDEEELQKLQHSPRINKISKNMKRDVDDLIEYGKQKQSDLNTRRMLYDNHYDLEMKIQSSRPKMSKGSKQIMRDSDRVEVERRKQLENILRNV